jgi:hypothetical protein
MRSRMTPPQATPADRGQTVTHRGLARACDINDCGGRLAVPPPKESSDGVTGDVDSALSNIDHAHRRLRG